MNAGLTKENYEALSKYRQERAHETLAEIPYLKEQGYYNTAVNRLYYACYYAAVALLTKYQISTHTHVGVKTMLGLHFVSKGFITKESGRAFTHLFVLTKKAKDMKKESLLKVFFFVLALILCSATTITAQTSEAYASLSTDKKTLTFYYDNQKSTRSGMGIGPFAYGSNRDWYLDVTSITTVKFDASFAGYSELTSTAKWFDDCTNLSAIQGIENLKTTNVTDMNFMFSDCSSLTSLDLSNLKLSKVTSLRMMFQGCRSLTNLNIEGWDTSSVTDMFA